MRSASIDRLRKEIAPQAVLDDPLQLALYGYDGTFYEGRADLVVLPETTEGVVAVARACRDAGMPIVPRGAATSLSGGPVPVHGGAVVAFTRMDRVLAIDYENQRAIVQPGLVNQTFQKTLAANRFFFAPDPASQCVCTLGGNVGENSGGPHCLKYGVTANHITGLTVALPDGRVASMDGLSLDGPGLDLTGIIVGSEGTLGLVTEIVCRILPQPEAVATMLVIFDSLAAASQSVSDIIANGIIPATLEMMDNPMIQAVEKHLHAGYPLDAEAVLIIEVDGLKVSLDRQIAEIEQACKGNGARSFRAAPDDSERALLWKGRKGAFGAVTNIMPSKICTDVSVPRSELPGMIAGVMELGRKWDIPITNVFHAGDGNLHPLILFDPRDDDQYSRAKAVDREITELALRRGGVLTGEHGIGCGKRRYMRDMFTPAELRLMWRIKDAFDPENRCNPGKVLPDREEIPAPAPPELPVGSFNEAAARLAQHSGKRYFQPADQASTALLLALAERENLRLVLRGAGTKSGTPPEDAAILDLSRLDRIVSADYANLTVTAECGVTLAVLDSVLAERGQMLGIQPRFAKQATLGGVISANESGPNRLLYGAPRDRLLGLRAALPNGEIVHFGGSCVKNVAGYAVEKLLIGSRGALAAILEVTLRTLPRPASRLTLQLSMGAPEEVEPLLARLLRSGLRPAAIELLNPAASRAVGWTGDGWRLLVGLEGFAEETEEMAERIAGMAAGDWEQDDSGYFELWDRIADLMPGAPLLKLSCPLSAVVKVAARLDALDSRLPLRASPGLGLVFAAVESEPGNYLAQIAGLLENQGGRYCWMEPVPPKLVNPTDGTIAELCREVKKAFDPKGILPQVI